jgi:hypothetical protein
MRPSSRAESIRCKTVLFVQQIKAGGKQRASIELERVEVKQRCILNPKLGSQNGDFGQDQGSFLGCLYRGGSGVGAIVAASPTDGLVRSNGPGTPDF